MSNYHTNTNTIEYKHKCDPARPTLTTTATMPADRLLGQMLLRVRVHQPRGPRGDEQLHRCRNHQERPNRRFFSAFGLQLLLPLPAGTEKMQADSTQFAAGNHDTEPRVRHLLALEFLAGLPLPASQLSVDPEGGSSCWAAAGASASRAAPEQTNDNPHLVLRQRQGETCKDRRQKSVDEPIQGSRAATIGCISEREPSPKHIDTNESPRASVCTACSPDALGSCSEDGRAKNMPRLFGPGTSNPEMPMVHPVFSNLHRTRQGTPGLQQFFSRHGPGFRMTVIASPAVLNFMLYAIICTEGI